MENAINTYIAASTEAEIRAAYAAMLEWSDAPEGSEADDVDGMMERIGLPSLSASLMAVAYSEVRA